MTDLFAPSLSEQVACLRREIELRRRVYPRWVADGRMKQEKADREIQMMEAAAATLAGDQARIRAANACLLIIDHLAKDFHQDTVAMVEVLRFNGYPDIALALAKITPRKVV